MACFRPMPARRRDDGTVEFLHLVDKCDSTMMLPCGQCVGCRLERSRQWAVRVMHEASLYTVNSFITLTYSPENLKTQSLQYEDFQKFMKRLRKCFAPQVIRFYMCGEYGEQNFRPHFHACLFNCSFPDKVLFKRIRGIPLYVSETLSSLWPFGFSTIGDVTFQSAAYVARYVMKKQTGVRAEEYYRFTDQETGEIYDLTPEFSRMSLKPGIGAEWFNKYMSDVYPHDYVMVNGHKTRPPRYYDKLLAKTNLGMAAEVEISRFDKAMQYVENNTLERLAVREEVLKEKLKFLKRSI